MCEGCSSLTIWMARVVAAEMVREAKHFLPLETGGILLGWRHNGDLIVMGIIGPGPLAKHKRRSFRPDHGWQMGELQQAFEASAGDLDYLGDWHTHPDGPALMSAADRRTLRRIVRTVSSPRMVIAGSEGSDVAICAWRLGQRRWFAREILAPDLRIFNPPAAWPAYSSYGVTE